jgi:hypothetical protein
MLFTPLRVMPYRSAIARQVSPAERSSLTNQPIIRRIRRRHSARVMYYGATLVVSIDCVERWPHVPHWERCDADRNERFARAFEGLAKQIAQEAALLARQRQ